MDDITLEKITYKNYIETIWKLKVKRCQKDFVASNNNSLAEAYVAITNGFVALPFAICKNEQPQFYKGKEEEMPAFLKL